MNLVPPTFQAKFHSCAVAEWLTHQTSNSMVGSSNPADHVLLQFIWAIDVFLCFLWLIFAPVIIKAANTTVLAGKKVDHTLFIILLLTTMCMPNFSYHCNLVSVAKAQKLNHHNLGYSKGLNRHFDWWNTNILESYDKIET